MKRKIFAFIMLSILTLSFASGCNKNKEDIYVKDGKEVIFQIGEEYYTADALFGEMTISTDNLGAFYDKVKSLVIKTVAPVDQTMRNTVESQITAWENNIKSTANSSGTSYKEAKAAGLASEGVSSVDELREKKLFALQQTKVETKYWKEKEANYYSSYLRENMVFHVSEILVKLSQGSTLDMVQKTISEKEAKKIADITSRLINGEKFYNVAILSDDETKNKQGGDLGLVKLSDSEISNEVKYALLAYAAYEENANINLDYADLDSLYENGIEGIPLTYVEKLETLASDTDFRVKSYDYYNLRMYPRSIIFNSLFNTKMFRFLVNDGEDAAEKNNTALYNNIKMPATETQGFLDASNQYVVMNDNGYPIIVVRDSKGLHFLSINMTPFAPDADKYYATKPDENDDFNAYVELAPNDAEAKNREDELKTFAKAYATFTIGNGNATFLDYDMIKQYMEEYEISIVDQRLSDYFNAFLTERIALAKLSFQKDREYEISNLAANIKVAKSERLQKELVPLICIDDKTHCKQTYANGFVYDGGEG